MQRTAPFSKQPLQYALTRDTIQRFLMTTLDTLLSEALAHHKAGRLAEAEVAYARALQLAPGRAAILHNVGVVVAAQGRHGEALAHLDVAIAAEPHYASAHYNRGVALNKLGRTRDAIAAFSRAAAIEPGHYDAHRALGFLWLGEGNRDRALDHFARTYELRRGEDRDGSAMASLTYASRRKLEHDEAQLRYIAAAKRDGRRFELMARAYNEVARDFTDAISPLSREHADLLGEDYNTAIHMAGAPEIAAGAVNRGLDGAAVARRFREQAGAATWIDDVLTPAAFAALRRYLLESTIWHDFSHIGGFVATYMEDGLASPLVLQIADELRAGLPQVLGPHPLSQAWAFKGLEGSASVAAHADDAAVSINLWVTPVAANLDPGSGGITICRSLPPADWQISGYEADAATILAFMERHKTDCLVVPYAANRAALFQSRLFHSSDAPSFAPGYENHRINVTLLYGSAQDA